MKLSVLAATSGTAPFVIRRLQADGHSVVAAGRDQDRLRALQPDIETIHFDLSDPASITAAIGDAEVVVSLAHARHAEAILTRLPQTCRRVVFTGSTRRFTRFPDPAADAVRRAEDAVRGSEISAVILHPTMIYGSGRDRNVGRLLDLAARWPRALPMIFPLPGGGRNLVQPILVDDLASAVAAAVRAVDPPRSIILAGPEPMTYAAMAKTCAGAVGRHARIVPVPARAVVAAAGMLSRIGGSAPGAVAVLRRFLEDRSFDIAPARAALGFAPRAFPEGLRIAMQRRED